MAPRLRVTMSATVLSPRPRFPGSLVVKFRSKSRAWVASSIPEPVSDTESTMYWPGPGNPRVAACASSRSARVVSIVMRPPPIDASRALATRFVITCSSRPRLIRTGHASASSRVTSSLPSPTSSLSIASAPATTSLTFTVEAGGSCRRDASSSWRVSVTPHSAAPWMPSTCSRNASPRAIRFSSRRLWPTMTETRLLKSWAIPAARRPTDSKPRASWSSARSRSRSAESLTISPRSRALSSRAASSASSTREGTLRGSGLIAIDPRVLRWLGYERQHDAEHRPGAGRAAKVDRAAVVFHDLVGEGQAESGARLLGREERVEDTIRLGHRDAGPRIFDLDADAASECTAARRVHAVAIGPGHTEGQPAAGPHGLQRIGDHVDDGTVQSLLVGMDRRYVARVLASDDDATRLDLVPVELGHPVHEHGQADQGEAQPGRPGQLEEPLDDLVDALQLARHHAHEPLAIVLVVEPPAEVAAEGQDRGQGVLDLVRQPGGEGAERGEAVRAAQLALEVAHGGEIAEHGDDAEVLAVAALERRRAQLDGQGGARAPAQRQRDVGDRRAAGEGLHQDVAHLRGPGEHLRAVAPDGFAGEEPAEQLGGGVDGDDPAVQVHGDDAVRDRGEDAVGVALEVGQLLEPSFELGVRLLQGRPLLVELRRHVVEGHRQSPDLVARRGLDALDELAAGDGAGPRLERLHRSGDPPRHQRGGDPAQQQRGHGQQEQLEPRLTDLLVHAPLGKPDPHGAPLLVLDDDGYREVEDGLAGGRHHRFLGQRA